MPCFLVCPNRSFKISSCSILSFYNKSVSSLSTWFDISHSAPSLGNEVAISKWHLANDLPRLQNHSIKRTPFQGLLVLHKMLVVCSKQWTSLLKAGWRFEGQAVGENGIMFPIRALVVGKFLQASQRVLNKFLLYCGLCIDHNQLLKQFHGPKRKPE